MVNKKHQQHVLDKRRVKFRFQWLDVNDIVCNSYKKRNSF